MKKHMIKLVIASCIICGVVQAATNTWDVLSRSGSGYGAGYIDGAKLQAVVDEAISFRNSNPDATVILDIASGSYPIEEQIDLNGTSQSGAGWLIIQGQGVDETELVDTEYAKLDSYTFRGRAVHRLKICDMSITGERLTSSQGTLVGFTATTLDIDLDVGFPIPTELFETDTGKANKVRLMTVPDPADPVYHYVEGPDNDHYSNRVNWQGSDNGTLPTLVSNRVWRFYLSSPSHPYQVGARLAVSSKSRRSNWGFFTSGGSDLVFENIRLKRLGRIKLRQDGGPHLDGVTFRNVSIVRPVVNGIPAMYSNDAGPQIGHGLATGMVYNVLIENCDFRGTTDDGTAFERVNDGVVRNNYWEDGGGVYVASACQPGLVFSNNVHYHCPLEDTRPGGVDYKGAYEFSPPDSAGGVLSWTAGSLAEQHDVFFGTVNPPPFIGRQTSETYNPGPLVAGQTYYGRVNEYNSVLGINLGDLLSFTVPGTPFELWTGLFGLSGTNALSGADPDNDRLSNLYEYGLGGDPTNPAVKGIAPTFAQHGSNAFYYTYPSRTDDPSLLYWLELNNDLVEGTWTNSGYTVVGTNDTGGTSDYITNSIPVINSQLFIRLKVSQ